MNRQNSVNVFWLSKISFVSTPWSASPTNFLPGESYEANCMWRWVGGPSDGTAQPGRSSNAGLTVAAKALVLCDRERFACLIKIIQFLILKLDDEFGNLGSTLLLVFLWKTIRNFINYWPRWKTRPIRDHVEHNLEWVQAKIFCWEIWNVLRNKNINPSRRCLKQKWYCVM